MRSHYFKTVCDGPFAVSFPSFTGLTHQADKYQETEQKSISLPEKEAVISTMLQEVYGVYNPTTGSLFANFALRNDMEKIRVMGDLLQLSKACEKVCPLSTHKLPFRLT
jgi:histone acetyltransferase HTATIP